MIDLYTAAQHYTDHMQPLYDALEARGLEPNWVPQGELGKKENEYAIVAANGDLKRANREGKMVFFMEHGAGQSYKTRHPSYAGGPNREAVCMFLDPGPHVTEKNKLFHKHIPSIKMGVPKLDSRHASMRVEPDRNKSVPTVCFSFHWDCKVCPETRNGFAHFRSGLLEAAQCTDFKVVGHAHPRIKDKMRQFYLDHDIEFIEDFDEVLDRADVYVCDNSSTIFEFASIGKPVVLLNPPHYRKFVNHGLRFWDAAGIGPNVWNNAQLIPSIREVMFDDVTRKNGRMRIMRGVYYGMDGKAAERGADAIEDFIQEMKLTKAEGNYLRCTKTAMGPFRLVDPGWSIFVFPQYAIVKNHCGTYHDRVLLGSPMDPKERMRNLVRECPGNYEIVEPDYELLKELRGDIFEEDAVVNLEEDGFQPANKELSEAELWIIQQIQAGLSKTKIVYSNEMFRQAKKKQAWDRLVEDQIIIPAEGKGWEVQKWGL